MERVFLYDGHTLEDLIMYISRLNMGLSKCVK